MVACSASRLVCSAMAPISRSTSPIFSPAAVRPATIPVVCSALSTALSATLLEWVTCRPIHLHDGGRELLCSGCHGADAGRCLVGGSGCGRCALGGALHTGCDFGGDAVHVAGSLGDRVDQTLHVGFEAVGHLPLQRHLLQLGLFLVALL